METTQQINAFSWTNPYPIKRHSEQGNTTSQSATGTRHIVDRSDISPEARAASQEVNLARAERIASIRESIRAGTYDVEGKMDVAVRRMILSLG